MPSAGRSKNNPVTGPRRRATPSEKSKQAPPRDLMTHVTVPSVEVSSHVRWIQVFAFGTGWVMFVPVWGSDSWWVVPGAIFQILAAYHLEKPAEHRLRRGYRIGRRSIWDASQTIFRRTAYRLGRTSWGTSQDGRADTAPNDQDDHA